MTPSAARKTFFCLDGHTCGNPVRMVAGGGPLLQGSSMSARRQDFMERYDWIRTALMFEPRGHDVMSGSILYPPCREDCDIGVLYIEVSGCLPMCGHGTIGTVTFALEQGLVTPAEPGVLRLDTPAGLVLAHFQWSHGGEGDFIETVRLTNVPSFLAKSELKVDCPDLGELVLDIAYGGNFYAIIDPQENYSGFDQISAADIQRLSPKIRKLVNEAFEAVHPEDKTINGVSHVLWTSEAPDGADGKNAVFYGDKAIDRSPCGTGTSAKMAQLAAKSKLNAGDSYIHESIIGSRFKGRVEKDITIGPYKGIIPSISGTAFVTGYNKIIVDDTEPFPEGFLVL